MSKELEELKKEQAALQKQLEELRRLLDKNAPAKVQPIPTKPAPEARRTPEPQRMPVTQPRRVSEPPLQAIAPPVRHMPEAQAVSPRPTTLAAPPDQAAQKAVRLKYAEETLRLLSGHDMSNRTHARRVQEKLQEKGFYTGQLDGGYGPLSRGAEAAFRDQYREEIQTIHQAIEAEKIKANQEKLSRIGESLRDIASLDTQKRKALEQDLKDAGFNPGKVDGKLDAAALHAIGKYREKHDPEKFKEIVEQTQKLTAGNIATLSQQDALKLEINLHMLGYDAGKIDGSVTEHTEKATKQFRELYVNPPRPVAKVQLGNDQIQQDLAQMGLYKGSADAELGRGSVSAIGQFLDKHRHYKHPPYGLETPTYDEATRQPVGITSRHAAAIAREANPPSAGRTYESVVGFGLDTAPPNPNKLVDQYRHKQGGYYKFDRRAVEFWKDDVRKEPQSIVPLSPPVSSNKASWTSGYGGSTGGMGKFDGRFPHRNHASSSHEGIDLNGGQYATAAAEGIVVFSGYRTGYGNLVVIGHNDGRMTAYAHGDNPQVEAGDRVRRDQKLFSISNSGGNYPVHLHFEYIDRDGSKIPPRFAGHDYLATTTNYYSGRYPAFDKQKSLEITGKRAFGPLDHVEDAIERIGKGIGETLQDLERSIFGAGESAKPARPVAPKSPPAYEIPTAPPRTTSPNRVERSHAVDGYTQPHTIKGVHAASFRLTYDESAVALWEERQRAHKGKAVLHSSPVDAPDSIVSSGHGHRPGTKNFQFHDGADLIPTNGNSQAAITASAPGIVLSVKDHGSHRTGYGKVVAIGHDDGTVSIYAHNSAIEVRPRQIVKRGEEIATIGNSGLGSSGTIHLHYTQLNANGESRPPELAGVGILKAGTKVNREQTIREATPSVSREKLGELSSPRTPQRTAERADREQQLRS